MLPKYPTGRRSLAFSWSHCRYASTVMFAAAAILFVMADHSFRGRIRFIVRDEGGTSGTGGEAAWALHAPSGAGDDVCPAFALLSMEYWFCNPLKISMLGSRCTAYSLVFGCAESSSFESAMYSINPSCDVRSFCPGNHVEVPALRELVLASGHNGTSVSALHVDCNGCEVADLSRALQECRATVGTNFTNVFVVSTPSLAPATSWEVGLFDPMRAMGYELLHMQPLLGRGLRTHMASFSLLS